MVSIAIADTHVKLIYDIIFIVISNIIGQTLDISDKQQIKTLLWILPTASEPHGVLIAKKPIPCNSTPYRHLVKNVFM